MSKERLEEIIFIEQEAKRYSRNNDLSLHLAALKIIYKKGHLNWLIEQAERVQELEGERDEWMDTSQSYYMTNQELRGQNKRYREVIIDLNNLWKHVDSYDEFLNAVDEVTSKALEGEECVRSYL